MLRRAETSPDCLACRFCTYFLACPATSSGCIGCGACVKACPVGARTMEVVGVEGAAVEIRVDGETYSVPSRTSLADALEWVGKGGHDRAGCGTGGCWSCALIVDGRLARPCVVEAVEGTEVITDPEAIQSLPPLRIVSFFPGHLHASMSLFTHGCNYACDFCHNWDLTFSGSDRPLTPEEAAGVTRQMTQRGGNRRTGISGGEPTLNRRWLVEYIRRVKADAPAARIQVDTNASLLTPDYIDELYSVGMTDISPDLKGLELETFQKISGIEDAGLAAQYLASSWKAVEYILSRYAGRMAVTVGLPYHPQLISIAEVVQMGERLAAMETGLDVNLIVYQPAFRRRGAPVVDPRTASEVAELLSETGLRVWLQTGDDIPPAVSPDELTLSSEEFF